MYRGLIHFHSIYSYDSITSIKDIVDFALKYNLNFLVLTDHNTIEGSNKLKRYIETYKYNIEIIIASEYCTEYGDIIALNIYKEIIDMNFDNFINEVKKQNGLLLFPHPYKGHNNIELIVKKVDMIEVFNSRTDEKSNEMALNLANKYNKPIYYATDAHNKYALKNSIIEFKKEDTFIKSLLKNNIYIKNKNKSYYIEVIYSQLIKSIKHKKLKLFISMIRRLLILILKFNLFKKV